MLKWMLWPEGCLTSRLVIANISRSAAIWGQARLDYREKILMAGESSIFDEDVVWSAGLSLVALFSSSFLFSFSYWFLLKATKTLMLFEAVVVVCYCIGISM